MPNLIRPSLAACLLAAAGLLMGSSAAIAQPVEKPDTPRLELGDPAPPLAGGEWVKGEPVSQFEEGTVYVLEMWATWCGPCIVAIPHITELQQKYRDDGLVVIGQNVWQDDPTKVRPFVEEMGDKMDYRIVMDSPHGVDGAMAKAYLEAAGPMGIPASFIIDRTGRLAWFGHPMQMDEPLAQVMAGTWDIDAEVAKRAESKRLSQAIKAAREAGDFEKALATLDKLAAHRPELDETTVRFNRWRILYEAKQWDRADAVANDIAESADDPMALNGLAWEIVAPNSPLEVKNLDVAMKAVVRACELTDYEDGSILDTLARVHYLRGDFAKAAEVQAKAVDFTEPGPLRDEMQKTLDTYRGEAGA